MSAPLIRTPEQIAGELHPSEHALPLTRPRPENKRVWASLQHPPEAIIRQAFEEATRRDPQHEKRWCALVDGNELQLGRLECGAEDYQPKFCANRATNHHVYLGLNGSKQETFSEKAEKTCEEPKWTSKRSNLVPARAWSRSG
jgi:hypothetical protein